MMSSTNYKKRVTICRLVGLCSLIYLAMLYIFPPIFMPTQEVNYPSNDKNFFCLKN